jgi:hypothetical protein
VLPHRNRLIRSELWKITAAGIFHQITWKLANVILKPGSVHAKCSNLCAASQGHFCKFSLILAHYASRCDFSKLRPIFTFSTWQQRIGPGKFSSFILIPKRFEQSGWNFQVKCIFFHKKKIQIFWWLGRAHFFPFGADWPRYIEQVH